MRTSALLLSAATLTALTVHLAKVGDNLAAGICLVFAALFSLAAADSF